MTAARGARCYGCGRFLNQTYAHMGGGEYGGAGLCGGCRP